MHTLVSRNLLPLFVLLITFLQILCERLQLPPTARVRARGLHRRDIRGVTCIDLVMADSLVLFLRRIDHLFLHFPLLHRIAEGTMVATPSRCMEAQLASHHCIIAASSSWFVVGFVMSSTYNAVTKGVHEMVELVRP